MRPGERASAVEDNGVSIAEHQAAACLRALHRCDQHPLPFRSYECPVCLDTEDDTWKHGRRWLGLPGCGHVVCSACCLTLANAGSNQCPLCRQCWHLPQLEEGSHVRIVHKGVVDAADDDETRAGGKDAVAVATKGGPLPTSGSNGPRGERPRFWRTAAQLLNGRTGHVESLVDASSSKVAVRLAEAVADPSESGAEGTGLEVAIVGVEKQHLVCLSPWEGGAAEGDDETDAWSSEIVNLSSSMKDALANPLAYSIEQLEALGLLPPVLVRCAGCERHLQPSSFSRNQLKNKKVGGSKCMECVEPLRPPAVPSIILQGSPGHWHIHGLVGRADLNSKKALLLSTFDARASRLAVQVVASATQTWGGERVSIRPANLVWTAAGNSKPPKRTPPPPVVGQRQRSSPQAAASSTPARNAPATSAPTPVNEAPAASPASWGASPLPTPSTVNQADNQAGVNQAGATASLPTCATASAASVSPYALAMMARTLYDGHAYELALQLAHRALEEAAAEVGGKSENEASARQRGVTLARNVLAVAADELAQQGWAITLALNEALERRVPNVLAAAHAAKRAAMDAAGACDAQLGDVDLRSKHSVEELGKLETKRAQSTALLERILELLGLLEREETEQLTGAQVAQRTVDEAREQQRASDAMQAMGMQVQALCEENERLRAERDEAREMRDDLLGATEHANPFGELVAALPASAELPWDEMAAVPLASPSAALASSPLTNPYKLLKANLHEGHWKLVRQSGGHPVYKRTVLYEGEDRAKEQTFSHAATPSDWRSILNSISDLRAQDSNVSVAMPPGGDGQLGLFLRLNECHRKRKEKEGELSHIQEEICMLESEWGYDYDPVP